MEDKVKIDPLADSAVADLDGPSIRRLCHEIGNSLSKLLFSSLFDCVSVESELNIETKWLEHGKVQIGIVLSQDNVSSSSFSDRHAFFCLEEITSLVVKSVFLSYRPFSIRFALFVPELLNETPHELLDPHLNRFIRSFIRSIHCSLPVAIFLNGELEMPAADQTFEFTQHALSQLKASHIFSSTKVKGRHHCTVHLALNVDSLELNSFSIIRYHNFKFQFEPTLFDSNVIQTLLSSTPMSRMGAHLDAREEVPHFPPTSTQYPLLPTFRGFWQLHSTPASLSDRVSNIVILMFVKEGRPTIPSPHFELLRAAASDCASQAFKKASHFFKLEEWTPATASTSSPNLNSPAADADSLSSHQTRNESSMNSNDETSGAKRKQTTRKPNSKSKNGSTVSSSKPIPEASKLSNPTEGGDILIGASPSAPKAKRSRSASDTNPAESSPSSATQTLESSHNASTVVNKGKRRRGERVKANEEQDLNLYVNSIVDSITSIVKSSQNMDFVSMCLSTMGIRTQSDAPGSESSILTSSSRSGHSPSSQPNSSSVSNATVDHISRAEDRLLKFRDILERDLRLSVQYIRSQKRSSRGRKSRDERYHDTSDFDSDDSDESGIEMEWPSGVNPDALWEPQPMLPSDAEWDEMLWRPCTIDLDESKFDSILM